MLGWLYRIFIGNFSVHEHEWETIKIIDLYSEYYELPVEKKYILCCKKCGNIKSKKV